MKYIKGWELIKMQSEGKLKLNEGEIITIIGKNNNKKLNLSYCLGDFFVSNPGSYYGEYLTDIYTLEEIGQLNIVIGKI